MTKKKGLKKAPRKKKGGNKTSGSKQQLIKIALGTLILVILVVAAGLLAKNILDRPRPKTSAPSTIAKPAKPKPSTQWPAAIQPKPAHIPTYEIYPKEKIIPPKPAPKPKPLPVAQLPEVAIIVDDIGYDRKLAEKFLKLDSSLTFSILPQSPYDKQLAQLARQNGSEIMLHLPMEPKEYPDVDPGPGALLTSMSPDDLIHQLELDLDAVPHVKGINNHMGSRLTANSAQMNQIFSVLKKRGLFFIDSKTAPKSYGKSSARLFQVPYAERDVFIDHIQTPEFVRNQIELMIRIAEKHGTAIGIAHPHEVTYQILYDMLPDLKKRVRIVPASKMVSRAG